MRRGVAIALPADPCGYGIGCAHDNSSRQVRMYGPATDSPECRCAAGVLALFLTSRRRRGASSLTAEEGSAAGPSGCGSSLKPGELRPDLVRFWRSKLGVQGDCLLPVMASLLVL